MYNIICFITMDITNFSGLSYSLPNVKEITPHSRSQNKNSRMFSDQNKVRDVEDPLQTVKMDPAVLDAQVTVNTTKEKIVKQHLNHKSKECTPLPLTFDKMMMVQKTALFDLTQNQFELLMKFTEILRQQRRSSQKSMECAFCKNNGEPVFWYSMHNLKDGRGRV
ncbi:uncharacterized protein LOC116413133 [Galleria mellonella]|uniref:Uncharacterized protein LOC116413133 n=1 Tax=Galleria mellonella TaxID=7137 RepID=A0ABM3M9A9_GALME|nr:uncharacterized protein LOC116413133 [Galleria mellonella]